MPPSTFPSLRPLRIEAGLTQTELADASDVRQATISEWESGEVIRVDLSVLDALCRVLSKRLKRPVTLEHLRKKPT